MPLFDAPTLLAYLAAATVLVLIPGPGTAWIVAQTAAGGTRRGLQAGLGLETATLIHATAAGLGLSALLATSACVRGGLVAFLPVGSPIIPVKSPIMNNTL